MTAISQLVSEDSRTPIQRLSRTQCKNILKANGIQYDPAMPKDHPSGGACLVSLIQGNALDITKPINGEVQFEAVPVADDKGNIHHEMYPVEKDHATKGKVINYDRILQDKADKAEKESENQELKAQLKAMQDKIDALTDKAVKNSSEPINSPIEDYEAMGWGKLKSLAKERGINTFKLKKHEVIAMLTGDVNGDSA